VSDRPHIIERAFQLAESGECPSIDDIRAQLSQEDYSAVHDHLAGGVIQKQLKVRIAASQGPDSGSKTSLSAPNG
jgi:hypothetical protein